MGLSDALVAEVHRAMVEVADEAVLPSFRNLADHEVTEKSPGEIVTDADRLAERLLTPRLSALLAAPVVGEEATAEDPSLLEVLADDGYVWLVDPIDGTRNFVAGDDGFGMIVALVKDRVTVAGWILQPLTGTMHHAIKGGGAFRNSESSVVRSPASGDLGQLRGKALTKFLPIDTVLNAIETNQHRFGELDRGAGSAAIDYTRLVDGETDFNLYWRSLPWDHAAGVLLCEEAGATARRPDRTAYAAHQTGAGLLAAAGEDAWESIHDTLLSTIKTTEAPPLLE